MRCPYCGEHFHAGQQNRGLIRQEEEDGESHYLGVEHEVCPSCYGSIISLVYGGRASEYNADEFEFEVLSINHRQTLFPRGSSRPPCPKEVPKDLAEDYQEACLVLDESPKASAALGRRCLQHLLRETVGVKHGNLFNEIQEVIDRGNLPTHILEAIDAIRNIGNFAAHPVKSEQTGEIVSVEPHEAQWTLDVLESLFDHYFVQPARLEEKKAALNEKLRLVGKPEMT